MFEHQSAAADKDTSAYGMLLIVACLWGTNVVMIKYLTRFFDPTALAALRLCAATLVLVPAVFLKYGWVRLSRQAWSYIAGVGIFTIFLHQIGLSWGLKETSSTHGVLILALNPLFTIMAAARFADEPFTSTKLVGITLGLSGVLLIVGQNGNTASTLQGDLYMFAAMLVYVIGSLFVKKSTATVPPLIVTAYSHIVGALGLLLLALLTTPVWIHTPVLMPVPVGVFLTSALLATGLGALLWNTSIQRVGASTASLFLNVNPIIGIIASALFLHEALYWQHFAALALVLGGVGLGTGLLMRCTLGSHRQTEG
jgi:drug/metabolite transporter (DMT)-like permease